MSKSKTLAVSLCCGIALLAAYLPGCGSDSPSSTGSDESDSGTGGAASGGKSSGAGGKGGMGAGGVSSGGATVNGGAPTGGASSGGATGDGGASSGGASNGGSSSGGASSGGASNGGASSGGASSGGASNGGASNGGASSGGASNGGSSSGGASSGGTSSGGAGTGGAETGGSSADSGTPCGNGVLDPGEECDPPDTAFCDADCRLGGDCTQCEEDNCGGASIHTSCSDGAGGDLCLAAMKCARDRDCYQFDPGICYCGAHDIVACQSPVGSPPNPANGPVGPCVSEFTAAASSQSPAQVLLDLTDPGTALGRAGFMMQCDQAFCPSCFP